MNKFLGALLFTLLIVSNTKAQNNPKFDVGLNSGIASGWWIYTLGTGAGIDRTDNEPKISFELEAVHKPKRLGIGVRSGI